MKKYIEDGMMGLLIRAITLVIFLSGCSSFVIKNIEPKYGKFFERKIDTTKLRGLNHRKLQETKVVLDC